MRGGCLGWAERRSLMLNRAACINGFYARFDGNYRREYRETAAMIRLANEDRSMKKQEVLELLERFPDEIDADELMYGLYLKAKLDRAEAAVDRDEVIGHEEVVKRSDKWFQ